jgi:hypothetical protein
MSKNIRSVIQNAADRKRIPAFNPNSIRDLSRKLRVSFPVSLIDLLKTLDELLPAGVIYESGRIAADNVHASAQLYLQSDGGVLFSGQAHESGAIGDNFILAMALLDVKDDSGNTLVFVHEDTLAGQLNVGFSDKEWHTLGFNQIVKDKWDDVKNTRVETRLHNSTDPWQVTEFTIGSLFLLAGIVIGGIFAFSCPEGEEYTCDDPTVRLDPPSGDPNHSNSPGVSVTTQCYCKKKNL